ncbi:MAG: phosphoenolpyruvate--protein phosphotransferase [Rhodospirillales bacterium]
MRATSNPKTLRRLLSRIRDVMAGTGTAQARLDLIVSAIAGDMVAEVCSIYVLRPGEVLELFATEGLKATAVHQTRLRIGEGLVGNIAAQAQPLALADAQSHPQFAFRPETGEEIYQSLMGVPILRDGRVLGVLVVQNRTHRRYTDEELEVLQTVAMVLAEMVAGGELVNRDELLHADSNALLPSRIAGTKFGDGIGIGAAVLHQPQFVLSKTVADDPVSERKRLHNALSDMHGALDKMLSAAPFKAGGEHAEILEAYRMFALDTGWASRIEEAIDSGLTAEAAVQKVRNDIRTRMSQVADDYLRERVQDFEDLANRLMQHLMGVPNVFDKARLPENAVVVARTMGPAELLDYDRERLRGVVLAEGSATSHVVILASALNIPVVGRVKAILERVGDGDQIIVDGDNGQVFLRPDQDVLEAFNESQAQQADRQAYYAEVRNEPAVTRDGTRIGVQINAGLLLDVGHVKESDLDGIGLYRTEIPFMVRQHYPDVPEQVEFYRKVYELAAGKPVTFRTLDVGGDKILPYWDSAEEENPAMGWRAMRVALDRPALLRQQIRALVRAAAGQDLRVMFPMVAEVAEFRKGRQLFEMEYARAQAAGAVLPRSVALGVMLEVPSLVFQLPALLNDVDFVSVGSNDLFQFLFASDRGNPQMSGRYDPLSPLVFRLLTQVLADCRAADVPVAVCGEMASRPLEAMTLIGLGFRALSISPSTVGPIKAMIRSLPVPPLQAFLDSLLDGPQHSVRETLKAYARDHGIEA